MKKILSLLALSGIVATASSNVVSCGASTKKTLDIKLSNVTLSWKYATNNGLYTAIRTQIAAQSATKITADDIKNDSNFKITLFKGTKLLNDDLTVLTGDKIIINVKLTINKNDTRFNALTNKTEIIHLTASTKTTLDLKNLTDVALVGTTGKDLYDNIRNQIATLGITPSGMAVPPATIKNDKTTIFISLWSSSTAQINDNPTTLTSGMKKIDVKVSVTINNLYFNELPLTIKQLGIAIN